jgi:DNA mismatch repair protein MSH2
LLGLGLGLAWSISEFLAKEVKCFTLFATHFHEITKMAESVPNVKNYHLASIVEDNKLTLLFKVKEKAMTKSFGIEVAEIAQLPEHIVNSAKIYLNELEMEDKDCKENEQVLAKIDNLLEKAKSEKNFKMLDTLFNL